MWNVTMQNNYLSDDDILYQLITTMNLDFTILRAMKYQTHFGATNYTIVISRKDDGKEIERVLGVNNETASISMNVIDFDILTEHYHQGIESKIDKLNQQINTLKNIQIEQCKQDIPKDICHMIGYDYNTLKLVGFDELVLVNDAYSDDTYKLDEIADNIGILKRYMIANDINHNVNISLLKPKTFKERYPIYWHH